METITGLAVIAVAALLVWGATWVVNRHNASVEETEFDQYDLPSREDFVLRDEEDMNDLLLEGLAFYGITHDDVSALRTFAEDKHGWFYGDIFRAFYRAQLGIK